VGPLHIVCFLIDSTSTYENKFVLNRRRIESRRGIAYFRRKIDQPIAIIADFFHENRRAHVTSTDRDGIHFEERDVLLWLNRNDDFDSCHFIVARVMSYFGCRPVIDYEKFPHIFALCRDTLHERKL